MDEHEIEQLLRKYVPVEPPSGLRRRIVAPHGVRIWPWAAAAGVMLAATIVFHTLAGRAAAEVDIRVGPDPSRLAVEQLTELLGSGEAARRLAESTIERSRSQAERAAGSVPVMYSEAP